MVSKYFKYKMGNTEIEEMAENNISSYDFYELYVSQNAVVYCTESFQENFSENIDDEVLLIFICEIAILQNAAISRINKKIVDELLENSDISSRKTLKLQVDFGKTILLWDNNIYNYYLAQRLSDKMIEAFGNNEVLQEYNKNKEHIERIVAIRNGIMSEIEGRILNILAFILSISELIQLIEAIKNYLEGIPITYSLVAGGTSATVAITILVILRNKKRRRNG